MLDTSRFKYLILHNHPEGLVLSQQMRDQLFSTGNVIDVKECSIHSLQPEFFKSITRRPLVLILWGMADRYGVVEKLNDVEVIEVDNYSDTYDYCEDLRPSPDTWVDDNGITHKITYWKKLIPDEPSA